MARLTTAPRRPDAWSRLEGTLKFRYLGIGFIWAWIYGSYETFAVYPERTGIGINADASWIASATVVVIALFVTGLVLGRRRALAPPWMTWACALAAGMGTLLSSLPLPSEAAFLIAASGALTGLGTGALYVLWGQALARLDIESAELAIPAASLVMLTCALVLPYLPNAIGVIATASLPVASGLMLLLTYRDLRDTEASAESSPAAIAASAAAEDAPRPVRWFSFATFVRISALLFLTYFVMGCAGAIQVNVDAPFIVWGIDISTLIGSACGIALMVAFVLFTARPSFDALYRIIVPLLAVATALLPWADLWAIALSTTFVAIADTTLTIAAVLFVVTAAKRGSVNAALGVGVTQGALQLGVLAGNLAGSALRGFVATSPVGMFTVSLVLLVVLSLAWPLYPANRLPRRAGRELQPIVSRVWAVVDLSASAPFPASAPSEKADAPASEGEPTIDSICQQLTLEHGLSGREAEILGYLARGRSQPYIREELVLSKNTVATHVKHIYQKLNVHSRQELLDLFE